MATLDGERVGSGTRCGQNVRRTSRPQDDTRKDFLEAEQSMSRSAGSCNTMGHPSTMASMQKALGMALSGKRGGFPAVEQPSSCYARI